jgi:hypothetical protein
MVYKRQIHGLQCRRSMVCNVVDPSFTVRMIHGLQCSGSMVYNAGDSWFTTWQIYGLQCGRFMVYNAADPQFTMRKLHGLQCGRFMVYNAAGQRLRMRQARVLQCGRAEQEVQYSTIKENTCSVRRPGRKCIKTSAKKVYLLDKQNFFLISRMRNYTFICTENKLSM